MSQRIHLAAIVARDGKLLLHRRAAARHWELPGGPLLPEHEDVDVGMEAILAGMGIDAGPMDASFLETIYLPGEGGTHVVYNLYEAAQWTGEPVTPPGNEAGWFAAGDVEHLELDERVKASLLAAMGLREPVDDSAAIVAAMERAMGIESPPVPPTRPPGLDAKTRTLQSVAILAALGRGRALPAYIETALDLGASREEIIQTLQVVAGHADPEAAAEAWEASRRALAARGFDTGEPGP